MIALIVTVFEPVPDAGEAFRLNALEAKSIDHEPLAGAVTVTVGVQFTFSWVDVSTPFTRGKNG